MRRRTMLLISVMAGALLVATVAGVAWAREVQCKEGNSQRNPCEGTRNRDVMSGVIFGDDYILAKGGNDEVFGFGGDDQIFAGGGNDPDIYGGAGSDRLYGGKGNDNLSDVTGPVLGDFADSDFVSGGPGVDTINVKDGDGLDEVCTGGGADSVSYDDAGFDRDVVDDPAIC